MIRKIRQIFSLILTAVFLSNSVAFGALDGVMPSASPVLSPSFMSLSLNQNNLESYFNFGLDLPKNVVLSPKEIKTLTANQTDYFLTCLTNPLDDFWVNLNPKQKDQIIGNKISKTLLGKQLLDLDLLLKKRSAYQLHPLYAKNGALYWELVIKKAQELQSSVKVSEYQSVKENTKIKIPTQARVWIVPDKAQVYESPDGKSVYIVKATLKVLLESEYQKQNNNVGADLGVRPNKNKSNGQTHRSVPTDELQQYAERLMKELIVPDLTNQVNNSKDFKQLRDIYQALILATWYKEKVSKCQGVKVSEADNYFTNFIDKSNLKQLNKIKSNYKYKLFDKYLASVTKGEFKYSQIKYSSKLKKDTKRNYISGGVELGEVSREQVSEQAAHAAGIDPTSSSQGPVRQLGAGDIGGKTVQPAKKNYWIPRNDRLTPNVPNGDVSDFMREGWVSHRRVDLRELPVGALIVIESNDLYRYLVRIEENQRVSLWILTHGEYVITGCLEANMEMLFSARYVSKERNLVTESAVLETGAGCVFPYFVRQGDEIMPPNIEEERQSGLKYLWVLPPVPSDVSSNTSAAPAQAQPATNAFPWHPRNDRLTPDVPRNVNDFRSQGWENQNKVDLRTLPVGSLVYITTNDTADASYIARVEENQRVSLWLVTIGRTGCLEAGITDVLGSKRGVLEIGKVHGFPIFTIPGDGKVREPNPSESRASIPQSLWVLEPRQSLSHTQWRSIAGEVAPEIPYTQEAALEAGWEEAKVVDLNLLPAGSIISLRGFRYYYIVRVERNRDISLWLISPSAPGSEIGCLRGPKGLLSSAKITEDGVIVERGILRADNAVGFPYIKRGDRSIFVDLEESGWMERFNSFMVYRPKTPTPRLPSGVGTAQKLFAGFIAGIPAALFAFAAQAAPEIAAQHPSVGELLSNHPIIGVILLVGFVASAKIISRYRAIWQQEKERRLASPLIIPGKDKSKGQQVDLELSGVDRQLGVPGWRSVAGATAPRVSAREEVRLRDGWQKAKTVNLNSLMPGSVVFLQGPKHSYYLRVEKNREISLWVVDPDKANSEIGCLRGPKKTLVTSALEGEEVVVEDGTIKVVNAAEDSLWVLKAYVAPSAARFIQGLAAGLLVSLLPAIAAAQEAATQNPTVSEILSRHPFMAAFVLTGFVATGTAAAVYRKIWQEEKKRAVLVERFKQGLDGGIREEVESIIAAKCESISDRLELIHRIAPAQEKISMISDLSPALARKRAEVEHGAFRLTGTRTVNGKEEQKTLSFEAAISYSDGVSTITITSPEDDRTDLSFQFFHQTRYLYISSVEIGDANQSFGFYSQILKDLLTGVNMTKSQVANDASRLKMVQLILENYPEESRDELLKLFKRKSRHAQVEDLSRMAEEFIGNISKAKKLQEGNIHDDPVEFSNFIDDFLKVMFRDHDVDNRPELISQCLLARANGDNFVHSYQPPFLMSYRVPNNFSKLLGAARKAFRQRNWQASRDSASQILKMLDDGDFSNTDAIRILRFEAQNMLAKAKAELTKPKAQPAQFLNMDKLLSVARQVRREVAGLKLGDGTCCEHSVVLAKRLRDMGFDAQIYVIGPEKQPLYLQKIDLIHFYVVVSDGEDSYVLDAYPEGMGEFMNQIRQALHDDVAFMPLANAAGNPVYSRGVNVMIRHWATVQILSTQKDLARKLGSDVSVIRREGKLGLAYVGIAQPISPSAASEQLSSIALMTSENGVIVDAATLLERGLITQERLIQEVKNLEKSRLKKDQSSTLLTQSLTDWQNDHSVKIYLFTKNSNEGNIKITGFLIIKTDGSRAYLKYMLTLEDGKRGRGYALLTTCFRELKKMAVKEVEWENDSDKPNFYEKYLDGHNLKNHAEAPLFLYRVYLDELREDSQVTAQAPSTPRAPPAQEQIVVPSLLPQQLLRSLTFDDIRPLLGNKLLAAFKALNNGKDPRVINISINANQVVPGLNLALADIPDDEFVVIVIRDTAKSTQGTDGYSLLIDRARYLRENISDISKRYFKLGKFEFMFDFSLDKYTKLICLQYISIGRQHVDLVRGKGLAKEIFVNFVNLLERNYRGMAIYAESSEQKRGEEVLVVPSLMADYFTAKPLQELNSNKNFDARILSWFGTSFDEASTYLGRVGQRQQVVEAQPVLTSITPRAPPAQVTMHSELGGQVANGLHLDRLLRIFNLLRQSGSVPQIRSNASEVEVIELCINYLREQGYVTTEQDSQGNLVVRISNNALNSSDPTIQKIAQAVRRWAVNPEQGVKAVNFQGSTGTWTIVGFSSELSDVSVLDHEQREIAYRKQGVGWQEAHNRVVRDTARGNVVAEPVSESLLGGAVGGVTPREGSEEELFSGDFSGREDVRDYFARAINGIYKTSLRRCARYRDLISSIANELELFDEDVVIEDTSDPRIWTKINQPFLEILTNAVDAVRHANKFDSPIKISIKIRGDKLIFEVSDSGIGLPRETLEAIVRKEPVTSTKIKGDYGGLALGVGHVIDIFAKGLGGEVVYETVSQDGVNRRLLITRDRRELQINQGHRTETGTTVTVELAMAQQSVLSVTADKANGPASYATATMPAPVVSSGVDIDLAKIKPERKLITTPLGVVVDARELIRDGLVTQETIVNQLTILDTLIDGGSFSKHQLAWQEDFLYGKTILIFLDDSGKICGVIVFIQKENSNISHFITRQDGLRGRGYALLDACFRYLIKAGIHNVWWIDRTDPARNSDFYSNYLTNRGLKNQNKKNKRNFKVCLDGFKIPEAPEISRGQDIASSTPGALSFVDGVAQTGVVLEEGAVSVVFRGREFVLSKGSDEGAIEDALRKLDAVAQQDDPGDTQILAMPDDITSRDLAHILNETGLDRFALSVPEASLARIGSFSEDGEVAGIDLRGLNITYIK